MERRVSTRANPKTQGRRPASLEAPPAAEVIRAHQLRRHLDALEDAHRSFERAIGASGSMVPNAPSETTRSASVMPAAPSNETVAPASKAS